MVKVLSPKLRSTPVPNVWIGLTLGVSLWAGLVRAQDTPKPKAATKPAAPAATQKAPAAATSKGAVAPATPAAKKTATPKDAAADAKGEASSDQPPDPSQTRKDIPAEVFRDPRAEALLNLAKFKPIGSRVLNPSDNEIFRRMAGDAGTSPDESLIGRVVDAQVAQLTDHKNIQALIEPAANPSSFAAKAIQNATNLLLEAIFAARSGNNGRFIDIYNRVLLQKLTPVLKNHLIPRVQAMIVLGQSGNSQALRFFLEQIKNPEQTALVKLWAFRGISNIKRYGRQGMSANDEINAARTIAECLTSDKNLPWPAQLRALEVLGDLRQGHTATAPNKLDMATVAMQFLTDTKLKPEVRAQAARALGLMQISPVVNGFNYEAIAYTAGEVAAELGDKIGKIFTDNPSRSEYYASFLAGPILEAFEGTTANQREGGLVKSTTPPTQGKVQEILNLSKAIVKPSVEMIRSGQSQAVAKQTEVASRVKALNDYLQKNPPKDRRLVPGAPDPELAKGPGEQ